MVKSNNQIILEKATSKAIDNGWDWSDDSMVSIDMDKEVVWFMRFNDEEFHNWPVEKNIYELLFADHDFARALWGEKTNTFIARYERPDVENLLPKLRLENWQYHLQQMVIAEDPIKYLGENI